jgi:DNA-directed RNA polymerase subunit RPC12/RpoP
MTKKKIEEFIVQRFDPRCPYCDQPISYDRFELNAGENPISCPSCQKVFIKVVADFPEEE